MQFNSAILKLLVNISVMRVYAPQFLFCHNKDLERWTLKPPLCVTTVGSWIDRVIALRSWTDRVIALRQISVTALFCLEDSRKSIFEAWGHVDPKTGRKEHPGAQERERELFGSSFYMFFFLLPGPALCKLGLVRSAVLPEVLTSVLGPTFDLPLFYFRGLISSLCFSHRHFGPLFPILTT